jgi:tellurite methyltransferase
METAAQLHPGRALDLACGSGRNALWLAEQGWSVTAVDGAPAAIEILRERASRHAVKLDTHVADIEKHEYRIERSAWDLIAICYYLQRDLFEPAKAGIAPGGLLLAIVHITEPGEEPTYKRMSPGELKGYFAGWDILHYCEGKPKDPEHRLSVAEVVAQRPTSARRPS